ncbi:MAG: DUF4190 domain-containing protein [Clostridia bacterium]|nr:DUF4190 domain-containing protein [Clostridia bacterium]
MDQNQNQDFNQNQNTTEQQDYTQKSDFDMGTRQTYDFTPPSKPEPNGYAIASLILGIVSIVLCCCSCISIVTSILAIVFAILSRQGQPMQGNAMGGMICGIISLVITFVSVVFMLFSIAETNTEDLMDIYGEYSNIYGTYEEDFNNDYYIVE